MFQRRFKNRAEAGRLLASRLRDYTDRSEVVVLALPRGGVPVAFEVARALRAPLDVFLVRKLGVPGQEELAMGAIASGGIRVLNEDVLRFIQVPDEVIDAVARSEQLELERRERLYRDNRTALDLTGRVVILVDDGLATGSSMRAAIAALKKQQPDKVVVAVPVAPASTCRELGSEVDDLVCLQMPEPFDGVGRWYDDFSQTTDEEVRSLLESRSGDDQKGGGRDAR
jgi:putative phosphoribosyl transferase